MVLPFGLLIMEVETDSMQAVREQGVWEHPFIQGHSLSFTAFPS